MKTSLETDTNAPPPEDAMEAARQARLTAEQEWHEDGGSLNDLIDTYNAHALTALDGGDQR